MTKWMIYSKRADFNALAKEFKITPVTARVMVNRGVKEKEFSNYLNCDLKKLYSPWLFLDMEQSVDILSKKINEIKKIRIIGDYDIDGICSMYILAECLKELNAKVDLDIPDRVKDGYGINVDIIERAKEDGIDTIITCDNGIAAIDEIEYAKSLGITVIVTDHHQLPLDADGKCIRVNGDGVINHMQPDCTYPYKKLCGAVVAYKFMEALYEKMGIAFDINKYIEFAAIATIGDVVDLDSENRIIAKRGLEKLKVSDNKGLNALIEVCQIDKSNISSYHIGFVIGPCLNAGGRLSTAKMAYDLLCAKEYDEAIEKALQLKNLNDIRKTLTEQGVEKAKEISNNYINDKVLVLYLEDIHESIAGIIAGRIKEMYYKPVIVLTNSTKENVVKGSGRSIEGYDMFKELSDCKSLFLKFGGHEMAAGLSLKKDNIDIFRKTINDNVNLLDEDMIQKVWIDVKLPFSYISETFIEELSVLEPFGKGNEKPVFAEKDVEVLSYNILGKNNNVLKMTLRNEEKYNMTALYFGDIDKLSKDINVKYGEEQLKLAKIGKDNNIRLSIAYFPQLNTFNGRTTVQIVISKYIL